MKGRRFHRRLADLAQAQVMAMSIGAVFAMNDRKDPLKAHSNLRLSEIVFL